MRSKINLEEYCRGWILERNQGVSCEGELTEVEIIEG